MPALLLFLFGFFFFLFLLLSLFYWLLHFHSLLNNSGNFSSLYQPVFIIIDLRLFGLLFRDISATTRRWQWLFSLWTFWRAQRLLWWLFGKHLWQKPALLWFWFVSNRLLLLWHLCHNWLIRWKVLRLDNTHCTHWLVSHVIGSAGGNFSFLTFLDTIPFHCSLSLHFLCFKSYISWLSRFIVSSNSVSNFIKKDI